MQIIIRLFIFLIIYSISLYPQNKFIIKSPLIEKDNSNFVLNRDNKNNEIKLGLVLSGGGARGLAQIGVLKVFEKYQIPIDLIVGNSMGSIVGGLYAAGYSASELESLALKTNWTEILSLTEETKRTELFLDQKQAREKSFLVIRFNALQPIIPSAISGGQRITNYLSNLTLQALYHPNPTFDNLKIPYRAVAADIVSGQKYIFDKGSLSEAMRASMTVPLLFTPLERDSLSLVDGGLVSNIPVDVAKSMNCDVIIVVNSTGELRKLDEYSAPWEVADQIMTIMMAYPNAEQLKNADVVLKPEIGNHSGADFSEIENLIKAGEKITERNIDIIFSVIRKFKEKSFDFEDKSYYDFEIAFKDDQVPAEIEEQILRHYNQKQISNNSILNYINKIYSTGLYENVYAEIIEDTLFNRINFITKYNPILKDIEFQGNDKISDIEIIEHFSEIIDKPLNRNKLNHLFETLLLKYRELGYSLARIDSVSFDNIKGELKFIICEGKIEKIEYVGNDKTVEYVLRREFPIKPGDIFEISKVQKGISNISSTGLFDYVLFEVKEELEKSVLVIKVKEKATDMIRFGVNANDERGFSLSVDVRDANFRGHGEELGLIFLTGLKDRSLQGEYKIFRIFHSYLTFNFKTYYKFSDIYTYQDVIGLGSKEWERDRYGEYRLIKYGGLISFGTQLERLGNMILEFRRDQHEIKEITKGGYNSGKYPIAVLKLGTTIDTKDRSPFTTEGMQLGISYESAFRELGSKFAFTKLSLSYEIYLTLSSSHIFAPKLFFGVADATLPLSEQYSLGGLNSFIGWREYDSRGRQVLIINTEYRHNLPFKLVYDTYLSLRYDIGMISTTPQELKLSGMRHGVGFQIGLDTPIGPAVTAVGRGFYLPTKKGDSISRGPITFYFSIGYDI